MFVRQDINRVMFNLKNIKSLFIVTDEEHGVEGKKGAEKKEIISTPASPSSTDIPSVEGSFENRIAESLFKALEANNIDGVDYFEFKNSLKSLASLPMDEATRYRSAFATSSTMGLNLQILTSSAGHYLKVLEGEKKVFLNSVSHQNTTNVIGKEKTIDDLNKQIADKSATIKRLTEEIQQHQLQMEKVRSEIASAKNQIAQTEANFNNTFVSLTAEINDDIAKINKYLNPQQ